MNGIRFTRSTQNTRSFGKFLAGNPTRPTAPVAWLPVGRRSSSQVTSAMSIPFSESMSVLLENGIPCILLFLNRNRISQNSPKIMHPISAGAFSVLSSKELLNGVNRQPSNGQKFNRQPSKKGNFTVNRQRSNCY